MGRKSKIILTVAISLLLAEGLFLFFVKASWLSLGQKQRDKFIAQQARVIGVEQAKNDDLSRLGLFWTRRDIAWAEVEPSQGNYQYQKLEKILRGLSDQYNAVITIRAISDWGTLCGKSSLSSKKSCSPVNMEDYSKFVANLVKQADGRIKYWQIEPSVIGDNSYFIGDIEQYGKLLQAGYKAVKKADNNARVILAGVEFSDDPMTQQFANELNLLFADYQNSFDIINLRIFGTMDNIPKRLSLIKQATKKPIFLTTGGPDARRYEYSPQAQAQEVCSRVILGLTNHAQRVFIYQAKDVTSKNVLASTLGLKTQTNQTKPAFEALSFCAKVLVKNQGIERLTSQEGVNSYQITDQFGQKYWYAWSKIAGHANMSLQLGEKAEIISPTGEAQTISASKIPIGPNPIWIRAPASIAEQFSLD